MTNDTGNSLTPINPRTGKPGRPIPVDDPYNMYFTTDGRHAIVVAERLHRLDFRNPHTFALRHSLDVPCAGVDHIDFSADGSYLIASCEFSGQLIKVNVAAETVVGTLTLPDGSKGMPQDVKLSRDGSRLLRRRHDGERCLGGERQHFKVTGFLHTGGGAHGLYPSRDARFLYVSNRSAGTVSVISLRTKHVVATWTSPAEARTWAASPPTARCSGYRAATTPRSTRSPPAPASCSRGSRSAADRTASVSGPSPAATARAHRDHALARQADAGDAGAVGQDRELDAVADREFAQQAANVGLVVPVVIVSRSAISAFERPSATRVSTSRSRSVTKARRSAPATCGALVWAANVAIRRRVTPGEIIASPEATTRIACRSSCGGVSLTRKPLAPPPSAA